MTDFSKPTLVDNYADIPSQIRDNANALASWNTQTALNKPEGTMSASLSGENLTLSRWDGSSFIPWSNYQTNINAAALSGQPQSYYRNARNLNTGRLNPQRLPEFLDKPNSAIADRVFAFYSVSNIEDTELVLDDGFFDSSSWWRIGINGGNQHWPILDEIPSVPVIRIRAVFKSEYTSGTLHAATRAKALPEPSDANLLASHSYDTDANLTTTGVGEMNINVKTDNGVISSFAVTWQKVGVFVGTPMCKLYLVGWWA